MTKQQEDHHKHIRVAQVVRSTALVWWAAKESHKWGQGGEQTGTAWIELTNVDFGEKGAHLGQRGLHEPVESMSNIGPSRGKNYE